WRIASSCDGPNENAKVSTRPRSCSSITPASRRAVGCSWKSAEKYPMRRRRGALEASSANGVATASGQRVRAWISAQRRGIQRREQRDEGLAHRLAGGDAVADAANEFVHAVPVADLQSRVQAVARQPGHVRREFERALVAVGGFGVAAEVRERVATVDEQAGVRRLQAQPGLEARQCRARMAQ